MWQFPTFVVLGVFASVLVGGALFFEARLVWWSKHRQWKATLLQWKIRFALWAARYRSVQRIRWNALVQRFRSERRKAQLMLWRTPRTQLTTWTARQTRRWTSRARLFTRQISGLVLRIGRGFSGMIAQTSQWCKRRWLDSA